MMLFAPEAEMVTCLLAMKLLLASFKVTVIVAAAFPSATTDVGEAVIVELGGDIGAAMKVT